MCVWGGREGRGGEGRERERERSVKNFHDDKKMLALEISPDAGR